MGTIAFTIQTQRKARYGSGCHHNLCPPMDDSGPGGGGETGGLAGEGVVGNHRGVMSPEQSHRVPAAVVIPHILLSSGKTCQNKVPQLFTQKIFSLHGVKIRNSKWFLLLCHYNV